MDARYLQYTTPDGSDASPSAGGDTSARPTGQQVFLRTLLGDGLPDGTYAHLFWLHGRETVWVRTVEQGEWALRRTDRDGKHDVYMGVGIGPDAGPHHRISIETALGVLGLVGDIDIAHELHKLNPTLPPDQASALKLVDVLGADPTLLVHSGHGIQTWHLFEQPWIFKDAADKQRAIQLEADWQAYINELAQASFGWEFDSVGDLARIMRVPGTWNAKDRAETVPVKLLRWPDARYTPARLEALC
ncbi:MAG TPA: hypothetical protein VGS80_24250, partial [Ktedonobacterales bacterium]|nr:hypothetical protein [Ktedonobacterales bacterium]